MNLLQVCMCMCFLPRGRALVLGQEILEGVKIIDLVAQLEESVPF